MNPDHFILTTAHVIWGLITTGGCGAALLTWWLTIRGKKKSSSKHPHVVLEEKIDTHIEDDGGKFQVINNHLEKQFDMLVNLTSDVGKIKGELGIE